MTDWLYQHAANPWLLFVGLILISFVLEDLATFTGAALAAEGIASLPVALAGVLSGIVIGDLGLYALGHYARRHPRVRGWLDKRAGLKVGQVLHNNLLTLVLVARFTPGMRLPAYTACGLTSVSLKKFAVYAVLVVSLWTVALFALTATVADFASRYLELKHSWWVVIPLLLLVMWLLQRFVRGSLRLDD